MREWEGGSSALSGAHRPSTASQAAVEAALAGDADAAPSNLQSIQGCILSRVRFCRRDSCIGMPTDSEMDLIR